MTRRPYEIRVVGALGPAAREAFAGLAVDVEPIATVLSGDLDQPSLHAVLDRVRALGLELLDVKQAPGSPPDPGAAGPTVPALPGSPFPRDGADPPVRPPPPLAGGRSTQVG